MLLYECLLYVFIAPRIGLNLRLKNKKIFKFQMFEEHLNVFKKVKDIITSKVKLTFLDYSNPFHLYTNISDIQLGATLVQDGNPLEFYTRKINDSQVKYTVEKKRLL